MAKKSETTQDHSARSDYSEGAWQLMLAAEKLFGRYGIEAVSLREIATAANHANNSAVQYHFGSEENLVQAVFEMHTSKLDAARARYLEKVSAGAKPTLRVLLGALLLPVLEIFDDQALDNYVQSNTRLTHRETSEHPFFRAAAKTPTSLQIFAQMQKLCAKLPAEAFSIRLRLASDLFLDSVAEYKRLKKAKDNPYKSADQFWQDILDMALAVLETPLASTKK